MMEFVIENREAIIVMGILLVAYVVMEIYFRIKLRQQQPRKKITQDDIDNLAAGD